MKEVTKLKGAVVAMLICILTACGHAPGKKYQAVSIDTPFCPKVQCLVVNGENRFLIKSTPAQIPLYNSGEDIEVICAKGGKTKTMFYKPQKLTFHYVSEIVNPLSCEKRLE